MQLSEQTVCVQSFYSYKIFIIKAVLFELNVLTAVLQAGNMYPNNYAKCLQVCKNRISSAVC